MSAHAETPRLTLENTTLPQTSLWRKFPLIGAGVGVVCLVLAYVLGTNAPTEHASEHQQFYLSYLTAFMFWLAICLGSFIFVLIQHGTRAGWSVVFRRIPETWMVLLPLFGLFVIPLFLGQHDLYHWSHPIPETDLLLLHKAAYYDSTFYAARTIVIIALWAVFGIAFYRWSTRQDRTNDLKLTHKMRWFAPLGFVVFAITSTLGAIDWMMSLDPHWYSTIFGVYYFAGGVMASGAMMILVALTLNKSGMLKESITTEHYQDLGKWTFAFIVFWAYIAFSQFFLIWYANIPEETIWYGKRMVNGWEYVSNFLPIGYFIIPFFFLMSRHIKRRRLTLAIGASWMLFAHYVDMFWIVQPAVHTEHFSLHIADLLTLLGIGGILLGAYAFLMSRSAVAPINDPRLTESLGFENT